MTETVGQAAATMASRFARAADRVAKALDNLATAVRHAIDAMVLVVGLAADQVAVGVTSAVALALAILTALVHTATSGSYLLVRERLRCLDDRS